MDNKIHRDNLKGKYIQYIDKNCSFRIHKVIKILGNTITVKDGIGSHFRIHPETTTIHGVYDGMENGKTKLIEIDWGRQRKGVHLEMKKREKEIVRTKISALKGKKRRIKNR